MDPVFEIKARLSIEDLVGSYCQLQKKGRNFVCVCPFHNDTHPSFLVSPDKGIAYCFACQSGGDIFSFYQKIEGVDFVQALKDLAERTGVELPKHQELQSIPKDEKERLRDCLEKAKEFYRASLAASPKALEYIQKRFVTPELLAQFELGFAPDSFTATYDHLLKAGFSRSEIIAAGLGVQRELSENKIYDRFRNRLMFPIHDVQGKIIGFGGRTLGDDDAKYLNTSDGPLYHKSQVLFGLHHAKEALREAGRAILVEGYFDVLACHRIGIRNVVAVSGTALTEQHAKMLHRSVESVTLCLDQDRAGKDAAERAFHILSREGLHVSAVRLSDKDPDETANKEPDVLRDLLMSGGIPYINLVLEELREGDVTSVEGKRQALERIIPLLQSLGTSMERSHYIAQTAAVLRTTEKSLEEDLSRMTSKTPDRPAKQGVESEKPSPFSCTEISLGLFLLYPQFTGFLRELIAPEDPFCAALYQCLSSLPEGRERLTPEDFAALTPEHRERAGILQLFCEHHGFTNWSDEFARREVRAHARRANHDLIRERQKTIATALLQAQQSGKTMEMERLMIQYQEVIKLAKMAS